VLGYVEERAGTEFDPEIVKIFVPMMRALEGRVSISHLSDAGEAGSGKGEAGSTSQPPVAAPSQNPLPFPPPGTQTPSKQG
jgi:hypothetical protein